MNTKQYFNWLIKFVIFSLLVWAIYLQIFNQQDLEQLWLNFVEHLDTNTSLLLILALGLMGINWGTEALKWQFLLQKLEPLRFLDAFRAIMCGNTLAFFTPNRVGEYGGRILILQKSTQLQGIALTFVGSFSQILANTFWCTLAFVLFLLHFEIIPFQWILLLGIVAIGAWTSALLVYFNMDYLLKVLSYIRWSWIQKALPYVSVIERYSITELSIILGYCLLRYMVYTLQYLILLWAFGLQIAFPIALLCIGSIFFIQTIVPSIALIEMGVRGNIALYVLGYVTLNQMGILVATFSLWFINLLLPALIGLAIIGNLNIAERLHFDSWRYTKQKSLNK